MTGIFLVSIPLNFVIANINTSFSAYIHPLRHAPISIVASVKVLVRGLERLASRSTRSRAEPQAAQVTRMERAQQPFFESVEQVVPIPLADAFKYF